MYKRGTGGEATCARETHAGTDGWQGRCMGEPSTLSGGGVIGQRRVRPSGIARHRGEITVGASRLELKWEQNKTKKKGGTAHAGREQLTAPHAYGH